MSEGSGLGEVGYGEDELKDFDMGLITPFISLMR